MAHFVYYACDVSNLKMLCSHYYTSQKVQNPIFTVESITVNATLNAKFAWYYMPWRKYMLLQYSCLK